MRRAVYIAAAAAVRRLARFAVGAIGVISLSIVFIVMFYLMRSFFIFYAIIDGSYLSILHNVKPPFYVIICTIVTKMQNFQKNTVIFLF